MLVPILDGMQTIPVFAYLLPILFLFGFGPVSALVATIIYAMPPMVRVTLLALDNVAPEIVEFGRMAGCTRRQLVNRVMMPVARAPLMVGVNQVIMLSLNMVIIASMIGAGGLGYDVLTALRRLDIGARHRGGHRHRRARGRARPHQPGLCAARRAAPQPRRPSALRALRAAARWRSPQSSCSGSPGSQCRRCAPIPADWQVSTAPYWDALVAWLNVNFFDTFEAIKTVVLLNVLVPVKRFLLAQPWPWGTLVVTAGCWRSPAARRALIACAFCLFIAFTGNWEPAMITSTWSASRW